MRKISSRQFPEPVDFLDASQTDPDGMAIKGRPSSDLTRERATYAMPSANTLQDKSIMAQSKDKPWHLCMVTA